MGCDDIAVMKVRRHRRCRRLHGDDEYGDEGKPATTDDEEDENSDGENDDHTGNDDRGGGGGDDGGGMFFATLQKSRVNGN